MRQIKGNVFVEHNISTCKSMFVSKLPGPKSLRSSKEIDQTKVFCADLHEISLFG